MDDVWFGTMPFGSSTDAATAKAMVHRCLDAGITKLDTADAYNWHASEEILGEVLDDVSVPITLTTKVGASYGHAPPESGLSRAWIVSSIDGSLGRLRRDHVDVYYMHMPDRRVPIDETLEGFEAVIASGKARAMGISNFSSWQCMEMISKGLKPALAQQMLSLIARGIEQEWAEFAKVKRIPTLAYNPLAGGLLTGKHEAAEKPAAGTRFDGNAMYQDRYWHPRMFDAVKALAAIAEQAGMSLVALALRWARQNADGILIGATTMPQLEENLAALDGTLDAATCEACDEVWTELRGPLPLYNR